MAGSGGTANSTVNLTVPDSAASGTDVTLTIEVQNAAGTDMNYIVLRFSVAAKVTIVGCQTKCIMILGYSLLYMLMLAYLFALLNKLHLVCCTFPTRSSFVASAFWCPVVFSILQMKTCHIQRLKNTFVALVSSSNTHLRQNEFQ